MSRDWLAAFGAVYLGKILSGILIPRRHRHLPTDSLVARRSEVPMTLRDLTAVDWTGVFVIAGLVALHVERWRGRARIR